MSFTLVLINLFWILISGKIPFHSVNHNSYSLADHVFKVEEKCTRHVLLYGFGESKQGGGVGEARTQPKNVTRRRGFTLKNGSPLN